MEELLWQLGLNGGVAGGAAGVIVKFVMNGIHKRQDEIRGDVKELRADVNNGFNRIADRVQKNAVEIAALKGGQKPPN